MNNLRLVISLLIFLCICACHSIEKETGSDYLESSLATKKVDLESDKILNQKWYEGKAEISVFELSQNRYNGIHKGEAVMIFVTEDFLKDKQVKNDSYTSKFSTPILKNNQTRKFATGLYDYSIFTSVFTDVAKSNKVNTLKVTTSSQDWCGQSFLQLNKEERDFRLRGFSYFEKEGDSDKKIKKHLLVDEIYNLIRIDDSLLPVGNFKAIPSSIYCILRHQRLMGYEAKGLKIKYEGPLTKESASVYLIKFPELNLQYEFIYLDSPMREIIEWNESYPSAFDGKIRTTKATRKSINWSDYWSKNTVSDSTLRSEYLLNTF